MISPSQLRSLSLISFCFQARFYREMEKRTYAHWKLHTMVLWNSYRLGVPLRSLQAIHGSMHPSNCCTFYRLINRS